jgi:membrane-bound serine protease (ClpP class)
MAGAALCLAAPVSARPARTTKVTPCDQLKGDPGRASVVKVNGLIDPVMADFIDRSITDGERAHVVAVVLWLDSSGSVISDHRLGELARHIHDATVPVAVWVGPSGASAKGGAAQLAGAAKSVDGHRLLALAPGSHIGKMGSPKFDTSLWDPAFRSAARRLGTGLVGEKEARKLGFTATADAPVIGSFLIDLPNFHCKVVDGKGGKKERQPTTVPVFSALPVQDQLFHTVASPPAAYLLFVIGLSLIVFELYTAGVGVAGLVGAGCFVLSCYGLAVLPTRPWGVALLVLAIFGFSVDVQTGVPRVWSGIGAIALVAGSLALYDGQSISWIALLVGIVGISLFMIAGMPAMVRTRFSTPTIGREWMIGEEGEAVTNISPDGVVRVRGALWRARTNRATPIDLHDGVRVTEVDGLLLEVEPLTGGAVDYREKRRGGDGDASEEPSEGTLLVDGRPLDE